MNTDTALVPTNGAVVPASAPQMIRPLATPDAALEAWQAFQDLKAKLITEDDIQHISGRNFVKKAGWRKIAAAFGISTECVAEEREELKPSGFLWRVRVRATAPNGRFAEGTAGCASTERRFSHVEHDVYAQAYTRACNRAISDLVGGGEVSAEEMKAEPALTRAQATELLTQFERSCDQQGVAFDHRSLAVLLLQSKDDLRRAFVYFRSKNTPERAMPGEEPDEEAPEDE